MDDGARRDGRGQSSAGAGSKGAEGKSKFRRGPNGNLQFGPLERSEWALLHHFLSSPFDSLSCEITPSLSDSCPRLQSSRVKAPQSSPLCLTRLLVGRVLVVERPATKGIAREFDRQHLRLHDCCRRPSTSPAAC